MAAVNPAQPLPMMITSFNGFSRSLTLDSSIGRHDATRKARKFNTRGQVFHVSLQNHSTLQLFTHQSGHLRGLVAGAGQKNSGLDETRCRQARRSCSAKTSSAA